MLAHQMLPTDSFAPPPPVNAEMKEEIDNDSKIVVRSERRFYVRSPPSLLDIINNK
jgi:hypothetical protein